MTPPGVSGSDPKYRQLASRIRQRIQEGIYLPGQPIPLHEDPSLDPPKARPVVERAMGLLTQEGWVVADRGGVYRASKPKGVLGAVLGWDPAETEPFDLLEAETRVLSKVATTLPTEFLEHFEVHGVDGRRASKIVKVYLEGGRPTLLETIYAQDSRLPGLVMKDHRQENIYKIIERGYRTQISRISQRTRVRSATEEETLALQIAEKSPILAVDRVLFASGAGIGVVRLAFSDPNRGFLDEGLEWRRTGDISL